MKAIMRASVGTAAAVLLLGMGTVAAGQEGTADEGQRYLYGELEGFLHPDTDNPFECSIGFTSDSTLFGQTELLGATTLRQLNCYVPTDTLGNVHDTVMTFTAESGDTLSATALGSGDCIPDDVPSAGGYYSCYGAMAITGGTGAFAEASGEFHVLAYTWNTQSEHPQASPGDTPVMLVFEGLVEL